MQGASPLASPGLNPNGTGTGGRTTHPAGGVPSLSPADLAAVMPGGVVRFLCRRRALPLAYLLSPIPPPPSRREGGGGDRGRKTAKVKNRPATKTIVPPAGHHSGKAIRQAKPPCPPSGAGLAGRASAARVQSRGCKGRSPLHEITLIPPLPAGKGVGGMGAGKQAKGTVGGRQTRQAPPQGTTATKSISAANGLMPGMQGAKPLA